MFQATDLRRIFDFCLRATTELIKAEKPFNNTVLVLLKHLLSILEGVLTWGFTTARHILENIIIDYTFENSKLGEWYV